MNPIVLTHGGAAANPAHRDGCDAAAAAGLGLAAQGKPALDAVLAAAVVLEDDPRFNAGTGSNIRLDGLTIQMDAALMTSDGGFGGVAAIERVKNPVLVAARVLASPHLLVVGGGAVALARRCGFPDYDPATPRAREKVARALRAVARPGHDPDYEWDAEPWRGGLIDRLWNFSGSPPDLAALRALDGDACDTIGAVARDAEGRFAAACSTGGTLLMLRGRVGDSPLMGCGLYAGPDGAVCATGVGEEIVRRSLSRTVYDWLAAGVPVDEACRRGIALFPDEIDAGVIAVSRSGHASAANRPMPVGLAV